MLTFEDPVEFVHSSKKALINQREIGKDSATYASAMRGALREDPDIIVVGDMRDPETIRLALLASETGHLVVATMQTTGAAATIDKLVESFPSEEQQQVRTSLSESLKLIVSQVLVPHANGTARIGIFELLTSTSSVRALIRDGRTLQLASAMMIGRGVGMQTIDGSLEERYRAGDITFETAMQYAQSKEQFAKIKTEAGQHHGGQTGGAGTSACRSARETWPACACGRAEAVMSNAPGQNLARQTPGERQVRVNDRIGRFLKLMKDWGASDLHLSVGRPPLFRVDGVISEVRYRSLTDGDFRTLIEPITPPHLWNQYERTGDVDFAYDLPGISRYRVNLFRQQRGMAAVFRNLSSTLISIDRLNLPEQVITASSICARASCWSPAPPARASRRRSRPSSTR